MPSGQTILLAETLRGVCRHVPDPDRRVMPKPQRLPSPIEGASLAHFPRREAPPRGPQIKAISEMRPKAPQSQMLKAPGNLLGTLQSNRNTILKMYDPVGLKRA
jgi:hypothetical protein